MREFGRLVGIATGLFLGFFYRKFPHRYRLAGTAKAQPATAADPDNPFSTPFSVQLHDTSKTALSSHDFEL
jgi:hypothetical protein